MRRRLNRVLVRSTSYALIAAYRLLGGYGVSGLENVPESGAAIIAPNHLSWADPPAIMASLRRTCWFMGNDDLLTVRFIGPLLPLYGTFPVHRGRFDREAVREAETHLRDGDLLGIFPEGGTSLTGRLGAFESGAALLAIRNSVVVIPAAVSGSERLLPNPPKFPRYAAGGIRLTYGKPIHPDEIDPALPRRERLDLLTERVHAAVAGLLPPEYLPESLPQGRPPPQ